MNNVAERNKSAAARLFFKGRGIRVLIFLCAAFFALGIFAAATLSAKTIYHGVQINDIKLGGMSRDEALDLLTKKLEGERVITLNLSGRQSNLSLSELGISHLPAETADAAYSVSREGNVLKRSADIFKTVFLKTKLPLEIQVLREEFDGVINALCEATGVPPKSSSFEVMDDKLIIRVGSPGRMVSPEKVKGRVIEAVKRDDFAPLSFEVEELLPREFSIDEIYDSVYAEAADAEYKVADYKIEILPEKVGVSFDKALAREIVGRGGRYGSVFYVPLELTYPSLSKKDIESLLFSHKLSEYATNYSTADVGRSNNLALAARKMNNVVLAPGDVFSYNEIVGQRTYSEGFSTAKVILNGELVDGVGGGVCQVSSTLYNTVLFANLGVVSRQNHNLVVGYVPKGQDATVAYGSIDFKFKNTSEYPIKIQASASGGTMRASILGTKPESEEKVTISNRVVSVLPQAVKEINDPALPLGERVTVQKGSPGYVVETYKTLEKGGVKGEAKKISTSKYLAVETIVRVGTGAPAPAPEDVPAPPEDKPTPTASAPPGDKPSPPPVSAPPSASAPPSVPAPPAASASPAAPAPPAVSSPPVSAAPPVQTPSDSGDLGI